MAKSRRSESDKGPLIGIRHLQAVLFFFGIAVSFSMRVNLSLAIVAMTNKKSKDFVDYSTAEKSLILSSFFWGYVLTQVPGGHFARKLGGKTTLLCGILVTSVMALLTPLCAFAGDWRLPAAARMIQGMSQGMVIPSTHTLLAKWAPKNERAFLGTLTYSGAQLGTVAMFSGSGLIASSSLGWPGIFYIAGGVGLIWVIVWAILGSSSPYDHKSISSAEQDHIEKSISNRVDEDGSNAHRHHKTPWKKFLTCIPFWALLIAHFTNQYAVWTMLTQIPTYIKNILKFNIKNNALITSLPYLVMFLLNFVFMGVDAIIAKNKWLSVAGRRKLFNTIGTWIPAAALVCLGYLDESHTILAIFLLVVAVGFGATVHLGFSINHIDLSPNFAGILMALTNTTANIMGIAAPLTVGAIVTDEENPVQWRIVFFIAAGLCFFGNLIFIVCGSGKVQSFNEPDHIIEAELKPMNTEKT